MRDIFRHQLSDEWGKQNTKPLLEAVCVQNRCLDIGQSLAKTQQHTTLSQAGQSGWVCFDKGRASASKGLTHASLTQMWMSLTSPLPLQNCTAPVLRVLLWRRLLCNRTSHKHSIYSHRLQLVHRRHIGLQMVSAAQPPPASGGHQAD